MTAYRWICLACAEANEASVKTCGTCGCPSQASGTEVSAYKTRYFSTRGKPYQCVKCQHDRYRIGETRHSGGMLSSFFEVETEKFAYIACDQCGYTEFYRAEANILRTIFDLSL
jgi:hypothetical protein